MCEYSQRIDMPSETQLQLLNITLYSAQSCQFTKTSERIFKAVDRLKWYKDEIKLVC